MDRKICFIDGSPRTTNSLSMYLIDYFSNKLKKDFIKKDDIKVIKSYRQNTVDSAIKKALEFDTIVMVTPLYFDGLPSHLLYFMEQMYKVRKNNPGKQMSVYMCINSGFLDSLQSKNAINSMKYFVGKIDAKWNGAISIGGGELFKIDKESKKPDSKLMKPVFDGMNNFVNAIRNDSVIEQDNNTILTHEKMGEKFFRIYANIGQIFTARSNKIRFKSLWAKGQ